MHTWIHCTASGTLSAVRGARCAYFLCTHEHLLHRRVHPTPLIRCQVQRLRHLELTLSGSDGDEEHSGKPNQDHSPACLVQAPQLAGLQDSRTALPPPTQAPFICLPCPGPTACRDAGLKNGIASPHPGPTHLLALYRPQNSWGSSAEMSLAVAETSVGTSPASSSCLRRS